MRQQVAYIALALTAFALSACDKEDSDDRVNVSVELQKAFTVKYPDAGRVEWEKKGVYAVADFVQNQEEVSAWFTQDGKWYLTETDLAVAALPEAVRTSFLSGDYGDWRVEDVDKVERPATETVYVIEVEQGKQEIDLYYSSDGVLVKTVVDTDQDSDDYIPTQLPPVVAAFIKENYPQARIMEVEQERGITEVDVIDGSRGKELLFDVNGAWISTSWDIRPPELPDAVKNTVLGSYAGYTTDDADVFETPQGNYYLLELERGEHEIEVKLDFDGLLVP